MKKFEYTGIWTLLILLIVLVVTIYGQSTLSPPSFEVRNGQVYLLWEQSGYNVTYTVLRSTIRGGYYSVIKDKLECCRYADTPEEDEKTYYYVITRNDKESGNEEARTKEIGVYVP